MIWGRTDLRTTEGQVAKISTYGNTGPSGDDRFAYIIKKATLPIVENTKWAEIGWQFTPEKQLCIGPTKNDTLGVCPGDSGAPLVVATAAGPRQVGIIESGDSNCQGPQVASKVTNYAKLFDEQLGGDPPPPPPPAGIVNGGFEAGDLSGWSAGGTAKVASVLSAGAHEGTRAARLGSMTATNGESTLSQAFTAPADSSQLSLHYSMTCPDQVFYAWAKVVLKDDTTGQLTTPLGKTCTSGAGWREVTASLTAGHSYTLTLVNRDDNHPDDAVYTLFDAVSVK